MSARCVGRAYVCFATVSLCIAGAVEIHLWSYPGLEVWSTSAMSFQAALGHLEECALAVGLPGGLPAGSPGAGRSVGEHPVPTSAGASHASGATRKPEPGQVAAGTRGCTPAAFSTGFLREK